MASQTTLGNGRVHQAETAVSILQEPQFSKTSVATAQISLTGGLTNAVPVELNAIYPVEDLLSPVLVNASKLLDSACNRLRTALEANADDDESVAADQSHHLIALLRELFCSREIGDGFGAVTNAALASLENLDGAVATTHQLTALLRRLQRIQLEPFISLADASGEIALLEASGLDVEPTGFSIAENWLLDD